MEKKEYMNTTELIKTKLKSSDYDFLRSDRHLKENIIFLTVGGSYAYGTNNENSDLDIRGVTLNSKQALIGIGDNFEQFNDSITDTTIYSFNKMIKLLLNTNPNV